ncbi:MAG: GNAT family N-acetyltransferase [Bacteroidetes bacterium]|nr:GNAT family N-acetyltransferase [Bacteroidota bacterium]
MLIYQLRQQVFMIEQNCLYEDIDGMDPDCLHLMHGQDDELIAYLRIVPPGLHFKNPALGRIIVTPKYRGGSTGPSLIHEGISLCRKHYWNLPISIEAQYPLESYYRQFGFESCGEVYMVDDIPHIHMILNP